MAAGAGDLVTGLGCELRGARTATERRDHDVLDDQTAVLGSRLFRAPLRPPRPSAPAYPQHRHHSADNGDSCQLTHARGGPFSACWGCGIYFVASSAFMGLIRLFGVRILYLADRQESAVSGRLLRQHGHPPRPRRSSAVILRRLGALNGHAFDASAAVSAG